MAPPPPRSRARGLPQSVSARHDMAPVRDAGARRRKKPWGAPASFGLGAAKTPGRVVVASRRAGAPPPDDKENANPLYAHVKSRVACTTAKGELDATRAAPRPLDAKRARLKPARAPAPAPAPAPAAADAASSDVPTTTMIPPGASSSSVFVPPQMQMPPPDRTPRVLPLGGATLHDLTAEDKRKVAKLIKQVVEYADARKKLEAELAEARAEATRESGRAKDAETLAEQRAREVDALEAKLLDAFARIKNYRAKIARLVAEAAERAAAGATGGHLEEGRRSAKGSDTDDDAGRDGLPAAPEVSIGASSSSSSRGGPAPSNDLRTNSAGAALSPLTAAVFAEIQSALERTPTERQRPPLGVAPADPRGGACVATERRRTEKEDPSERAEKRSKASGSIPPPRLPPETPIVPGLSPASARDLRWLARMHGAGDAIFGERRPNQRTDGRSSAADDVYPPRAADAAAAASSNDLRTTSDGAEVGSDPEPSRARPPEPSASRPSARAREPTPELPDEVRVAAALAAGARAAERARAERDEASSEKTRLLRREDASEEKTLLPSSASAAASSVASPHIPSPPPHGTGGMSSGSSVGGGGVGAPRVRRAGRGGRVLLRRRVVPKRRVRVRVRVRDGGDHPGGGPSRV